jgi:hypothetical protein
MENEQKIANDSAQPDRGAVGQHDTVTAAHPGTGSASDGASKSDSPQPLTRATLARKDKGELHVRHHGVLSRNPMQALIRLGENPRELLKIEKMLRAELKPTGMLGKNLFDRAWSSFLRCLLIARMEARLFMPVSQNDADQMPELKEMEVPTLVWPEPGASNYNFSDDLTRRLETVLRYDAHFAREFYRAVGMLLALQNGGVPALLNCL